MGMRPVSSGRPMVLKGYHPQFGRQQAPLPHNPRARALVASKPFRCQVQDHRVHQKDGDALHEINTMNEAVLTEECMQITEKGPPAAPTGVCKNSPSVVEALVGLD